MNSIKLTAKQVLFDNHISGSPADSIDKILQRENIELIKIRVEDDSCGMYCIEDDKLKIYVNSNMNTGRINFTIAHELGHHFLSHTLDGFCRIYRNLEMDTHKKSPQEVEANYFAACFLMPYELVLPIFNRVVNNYGRQKDTALSVKEVGQAYIVETVIITLAKELKVSKKAVSYCLKSLKLLKAEQK